LYEELKSLTGEIWQIYVKIHLPVHPVALMFQDTYMAKKTVFLAFLIWPINQLC